MSNNCEEIIDRINDVLEKQPVDEIGITFDPSLPVVFYEDKKLGISKQLVKDVFKHCLHLLYDQDLSDRNHQNRSICVDKLVRVTRVLLIIKGDFPIVYNYRKKLIEDSRISLSEEMPFLALIFQNHPKSPSGWQHRRWCIYRSKGDASPKTLTLSELETERELCRLMSEKYPKNYYAWTHRLWLLQFMSDDQLAEELLFTEGWLYAHVSDHSAANHRVQVAHRIIRSGPSTMAYILEHCLQEVYLDVRDGSDGRFRQDDVALDHFSSESFQSDFKGYLMHVSSCLIVDRPGHESLWYHRRSLFEFIMHNVINSAVDAKGSLLFDDGFEAQSMLAMPADHKVESNDVWKQKAKSTYKQLFQQLAVALDSGVPLHHWLTMFIQSELQLVHRCMIDESVWSFEKQKLNAVKYANFVLERALRYHGQRQRTPEIDSMEVRLRGMLLHWNNILIATDMITTCR